MITFSLALWIATLGTIATGFALVGCVMGRWDGARSNARTGTILGLSSIVLSTAGMFVVSAGIDADPNRALAVRLATGELILCWLAAVPLTLGSAVVWSVILRVLRRRKSRPN